MIKIEEEISKHINESYNAKQRHLFRNENITFRQLKDTLSDILGDRILKMSRKVPMVDLYLTQKDGKWLVSSYVRPSRWMPIRRATSLNEVESTQGNVMSSTLDDIAKACEGMDDIFLNKCFANGKNKAHIGLIFPPNGYEDKYGNKCFIAFKGIDCFNDKGKCIGSDEDLGIKFLYNINSSDCLQQELAQLPAEKISCIKCCKNEEKTLSEIISALSKLIDGIGWGCSLKYYIEDKYSRYIINKALEHGLDISKNGQFANELVSRLSGTIIRPTKSDLVTFAKREGIDCKSEQYKQFLDDIENTSSQMCHDIISPIEKIICYAISCIANNVIAMMNLDPNPQAQKMLSSIATRLFDAKSSIDACEFDINDLQVLKKALAKLCAYGEIAPSEVRIMHNHMPYSLTCNCKSLQKLCELI